MTTLIKAAIIAIFIASQCTAGTLQSEWADDFCHQVLSQRPRLEARYADATRAAIDIDAQDYRITVNLAKQGGHRVTSFKVNTPGRPTEVLAKSGIYVQLIGSDGTLYSSLNSTTESRINIYRRGPYYTEVHWLDIQLADKSGKAAPVKGEIIFYCYPEKVHVGAILHVTEDIQVRSAQVRLDMKAQNYASSPAVQLMQRTPSYIRPQQRPASSCAIIYPAVGKVDGAKVENKAGCLSVANFIYDASRHKDTAATWAKDQKPAAYFELLPMPNKGAEEALALETTPILWANIQASEGRYLGYDPIRGCYTVKTDSIGGFTQHFNNPNAYETATFTIKNGPTPRKIYILHETGANTGAVECGAVLDDQGYPLPITVQTSKNFCGEREEKFYNPKDNGFSETFFPLYLAPNERRQLTSLHLYQNWGNHPLKQFSSLGAWVDWFHMSTGVTETTCYVPFKYPGLPGVAIGDLRPFSQNFMPKQPQHNNVAGHSFLRYQDSDNKWHYTEYVGTDYRSTGPNWADMSINYLTDDGKTKLRIDVFELPQVDETRNFVHIRIDFLSNISIKNGDLARNLQILNVTSLDCGMRYDRVAYGGATGDPTVVPINFNDDFTIAGAPLARQNSFATIYPDKNGANAFVVRNCSGRIDGKSVSLGVSAIGWKTEGYYHNPKDTVMMLVPVTDAKKIKAGDYIEADIFMMPYGEGDQTPAPVQKAAFDYGVNAPRITAITQGTKLADFPTRIALDKTGKAEFTVAGGFECIPIIVEGARDYRNLRLYCLDDGKKTLVEHSQAGMSDGYQLFARRDGTFGSVFLFKTDGKEHRFAAE